MKHFTAFKMVLTALFAAMICVATMLVQIPIPATGGYANLGDGVILICSFLLHPLHGFRVCGFCNGAEAYNAHQQQAEKPLHAGALKCFYPLQHAACPKTKPDKKEQKPIDLAKIPRSKLPKGSEAL